MVKVTQTGYKLNKIWSLTTNSGTREAILRKI